jgi:formate-dependent phosphoribosylglycinamide formyltransferase (GAR transformylase)
MHVKVLLLDTAFAAVPIHDWLVSVGCEVWTIGNRPNDPLALSAPERWLCGNYSDVEFVRDLISEHSFEAVVPGCTDVSMNTFVLLDFQKYYQCSKDVDQILNNKKMFRKICEELDLPAPRVITLENLPKNGQFICKPADSFSGRGVGIFDASNSSEVRSTYEQALAHSPTGAVICEEFVDGQLFSYSAFIESGKVVTAFSVIEGSRYDPFAVDTSYLVDDIHPDELRLLKESVEALAARLTLGDGLFHVQYIRNHERIAIVEVTRRCPGDLYSMLIEYTTGFPYAAQYASYFIGHRLNSVSSERHYIMRHTLKQTGEKSFSHLDMSGLTNVFSIFQMRRLGEALNPSLNERVAVVFMKFPEQNALEGGYSQVLATKKV